jgi:hypothetical protein|tara:strand:+ start:264 stop:383 length:120 start_codon:yes stop_codon:yes gene_type:complete
MIKFIILLLIVGVVGIVTHYLINWDKEDWFEDDDWSDIL